MTDYERIAKVIQYIDENFKDQPSLSELAEVAGLSESHFHRLFTSWARVTPKDFVKFLTASYAKSLLKESKDLLTTTLESGLSSPGRLHDLLVSMEAVTPGEFKSKGKGVVIDYGFHETPFGTCLIGLTSRGICFLSFCDLSEDVAFTELREKWSGAELVENLKTTGQMIKLLFVEDPTQKIPVLVMGSPFQIKVWEALLRIPEGQLRSYSDIAEAIESPKSSRAVGTAIGDNSLAFIIPCHRVIRATGEFSNYRWNPIRKKAIIAWEQGHRQDGR